MLSECISIFEKELEKDPDLVLNNYVPKDGRYCLVKMNDSDWEVKSPLEIKFDKKNASVQGSNDIDYQLIKFLDYYSNLLEMNKSLDPKKTIHTSNYYSFGFKENIFTDKVNNEAITRYFSILKNPSSKYKDKKSKELYDQVEKSCGQVNVEEVEKIEDWLIKNLPNLPVIEENKTYFKIFFIYEDLEKTKEAYKMEQARYVSTNIFNSNSFNIKIGGEIYGLSNNNMGLNSKKPYLANLSRMVSEPYMLTTDEAIRQRDFFEYLQAYVRHKKYRIYFNTQDHTISDELGKKFTGYELILYPEKNEAAIKGFNHFVGKEFADRIRFFQLIEEKVYDEDKDRDKKLEKINKRYEIVGEARVLLERIDDVFFLNHLMNNYPNFTEANIRDQAVDNMVRSYGQIIIDWAYYSRDEGLKDKLDRLVYDSLSMYSDKGYTNKARAAFNYYLSLKEHFYGGVKDSFMSMQETMKGKILSKEDYKLESDEECLFAIGQVMRFIQALNNMGNKNLSFIQTMQKRTDPRLIVEDFYVIINKYNHLISTQGRTRSSILIAKILDYQFNKEKVSTLMLTAGFLDDNYLLKKIDDGKDKKSEI